MISLAASTSVQIDLLISQAPIYHGVAFIESNNQILTLDIKTFAMAGTRLHDECVGIHVDVAHKAILNLRHHVSY